MQYNIPVQPLWVETAKILKSPDMTKFIFSQPLHCTTIALAAVVVAVCSSTV